MKRKAMTQQVVSYELSATEHEEALREYIDSHTTEDGVSGLIPQTKTYGVQDVDFTLLSAGGAIVSVIYEGKAEEKPKPEAKKETP